MAGKKPKGRRVVKGAHSKSMQRDTTRAAAPAQADRALGAEVAKRRQLEAALFEAQAAVELAMEGISKLDDRGHYLFVNAHYAALLGYRPEELIGQSWEVTVHPEDRTCVSDTFARMLASGRAEAEVRAVKKDGSLFHKHVVMVKPGGLARKHSGHFCFMRDMSQRQREAALLAAETQALELVAQGAGLPEVLTFICRTIEGHTAPMLCSVMEVMEDGAHLSSVAGPSLPDEYNRLVHGIPIGPAVGSCGSAAYFGKPVIVADIAADPLWKDYAPLALAHGLRACWSHPIVGSAGDVIGTFAAYYREPRAPHPSDLAVVERASHMAALAIEHARVRESLRASEQRHRSVVAALAEGVVIQDQDGRIRSCNASACRILGLTEEQVLGRSSLDPRWQAIHEDGSPFPGDKHPAIVTLRTGRASENVIMGVYRPDGSLVWISINTQPIIAEGGQPTGVVASFRDITAQKQRDADLKLFRALLDQVTDSIEVIDPSSGRFLDGNRQAHESIGYTRNELLGLTVPDIDPLVTKPVFQEYMRRLREAGAPLRIESLHRRKDGTTFPVEVVAQLIHHEREYLVAVVRDIAARKCAEAHLQRTSFAMDQAVDAVYWIDPQGRILYSNGAASAMLGYTVDEFLGMTVHDLNPEFPPERWPGWWAETRESKVMSLETVHRTKDGRRIPIDLRVSFLAYGGQEFHCVFVRNISEQKRVDEALRASQERFELAVRATNDGIWDWNILTGAQYWSDRHRELLGREHSEGIPTFETWMSLMHPDDADRVRYATHHHLQTRAPYDIEARVRMNDGSYRWFRDRGQAVWDRAGRPVRMVGSISDVTEQKHAEEAVQQAQAELERRVHERTAQLAQANRSLQDEMAERTRVEDRLRMTQHAVDHASDQIFVISSNGSFVDVNEAACRRLGYAKEELLAMSVIDIDPDFPPDAWAHHWEMFRQAGQVHLETRHRSQSGEIYPVEVTANYHFHNGQELDYAIVRDISDRKAMEIRLARHAEELEQQVVQRTAEVAKLEAQRAQVEHLAALGRLAAGVAHEINNPIAGIKNAFTLVKQAVDPAHPQYAFVGMVDREIDRVSSIVRNMYQLYRRDSGKVETVDLRTMIRDIEALFAKQLQQRRLRLVIEMNRDLSRLNVPRSDLLQVLLNLLNNAIDCSHDNSAISLTIGEEAEVIRIAVADQGAGIAPEILPHIFDPFFTTKTVGDQKGMGLGLSISQSLVTAMGGRIEVHTQLGHGSTFSVLVPRHVSVAPVPDQIHHTRRV